MTTQQFFNTIIDCLKWCADHPDQRCRDGQGREIWVEDRPDELSSQIGFLTNLNDEKKPTTLWWHQHPLNESNMGLFDLATLRPVSIEPQKPTLDNLAALENWDWFNVKMPNGDKYQYTRQQEDRAVRWTEEYFKLQTALSAGWPVEFGRDEA